MNTLKIKRLTPEATLPTRAHESDAGLDLYAAEDAYIGPRAYAVDTGISVDIPHGYVGLVHPRSGLAAKHGITVVNAPGTIDAGYTGPVKVILVSHHGTDSIRGFKINKGDRIAQLVIQKVELPAVEEVFELADSVRGSGGFGSTGV